MKATISTLKFLNIIILNTKLSDDSRIHALRTYRGILRLPNSNLTNMDLVLHIWEELDIKVFCQTNFPLKN